MGREGLALIEEAWVEDMADREQALTKATVVMKVAKARAVAKARGREVAGLASKVVYIGAMYGKRSGLSTRSIGCGSEHGVGNALGWGWGRAEVGVWR